MCWLSLPRCFDGKIFFADADVPLASDTLATFTIHRFIAWLRRSKAIDIAVIHAERSGDEHGIVNLNIGCAQLTGLRHCLCSYVLSTALNLSCDDQKCFQFVGYLRVVKVKLHTLHEPFVI